MRGGLGRAFELAAAATAPRDTPETPGGFPCAAAEVALAWAHLERHQLDEAGKGLSRSMKALRIVPDKLVSSLACLVAARHSLATGHPDAASAFLSQARTGWSPPAWLEHKLMLARSHNLAAAGDAQAALSIGMRAEPEIALEALIAVAHAQVAARDPEAASQTLAGAHTAALDGAPDHVRLEARLVEAAASYRRGDGATGRKCLAQALKLAEREHVQLPFALERAWIQPVLRQDSRLAEAFQRAFATSRTRVDRGQKCEARPGTPPAVVDSLSGRELEVLRHVSSLESNSEIAEAMYLSIHTVKTHIRHILNKLGVQHRAEAVRMARRLQLL